MNVRALFAGAAALLAGCASIDANNVSDEQTSVAIQRAPVDAATAAALDAANAAFSAAWLRGDVDALLAAYTDVAVVHPPAGGVLTTREQIRGVWAPIVNWQRVGHRLEPTLRWALSERRVLEMGRWHSSRTVNGESPWATGCYTVIWNLGFDGRWRMDYDAWTGVNDNSWACRPR